MNGLAGHVGLTFDDGPDPRTTGALLAALRAAGLRATMFNIGRHARRHPALARAQRTAGMWIGNHSWSHPALPGLPLPVLRAELRDTQRELRGILGAAPVLFRPPYGATSATVGATARRLGLTEVHWDVDSRDWAGAGPGEIAAAAARLTDGQVILLHDRCPATIAAVPLIAIELRRRGLAAGAICQRTGRAVPPDRVRDSR